MKSAASILALIGLIPPQKLASSLYIPTGQPIVLGSLPGDGANSGREILLILRVDCAKQPRE